MATPTADQILRVRRLAIGTSADTVTLPDADVIDLWDNEGVGAVLLTAAESCLMLAARPVFAFSADGQSVNKGNQPADFRRRAAELKAQHYGSDLSGSMQLARVGDTDETEYTA